MTKLFQSVTKLLKKVLTSSRLSPTFPSPTTSTSATWYLKTLSIKDVLMFSSKSWEVACGFTESPEAPSCRYQRNSLRLNKFLSTRLVLFSMKFEEGSYWKMSLLFFSFPFQLDNYVKEMSVRVQSISQDTKPNTTHVSWDTEKVQLGIGNMKALHNSLAYMSEMIHTMVITNNEQEVITW